MATILLNISFPDSFYNNFTIGTAYDGDTTTAVTEIYGTNKDTTLTIGTVSASSDPKWRWRN